jgi:hypothetical protein
VTKDHKNDLSNLVTYETLGPFVLKERKLRKSINELGLTFSLNSFIDFRNFLSSHLPSNQTVLPLFQNRMLSSTNGFAIICSVTGIIHIHILMMPNQKTTLRNVGHLS